MEGFYGVIELIILAVTLLVSVYFSYRSTRIQQKILTIKSAEEFSKDINNKRRELEKTLGFSIKSGTIIDANLLLSIEEDPNKRLALIDFLNLYESMSRGINLDAYDEEIFKIARASVTVRTYFAFEDFIIQYRRKYNRGTAWIEYEKLAKKWR